MQRLIKNKDDGTQVTSKADKSLCTSSLHIFIYRFVINSSSISQAVSAWASMIYKSQIPNLELVQPRKNSIFLQIKHLGEKQNMNIIRSNVLLLNWGDFVLQLIGSVQFLIRIPITRQQREKLLWIWGLQTASARPLKPALRMSMSCEQKPEVADHAGCIAIRQLVSSYLSEQRKWYWHMFSGQSKQKHWTDSKEKWTN